MHSTYKFLDEFSVKDEFCVDNNVRLRYVNLILVRLKFSEFRIEVDFYFFMDVSLTYFKV